MKQTREGGSLLTLSGFIPLLTSQMSAWSFSFGICFPSCCDPHWAPRGFIAVRRRPWRHQVAIHPKEGRRKALAKGMEPPCHASPIPVQRERPQPPGPVKIWAQVPSSTTQASILSPYLALAEPPCTPGAPISQPFSPKVETSWLWRLLVPQTRHHPCCVCTHRCV